MYRITMIGLCALLLCMQAMATTRIVFFRMDAHIGSKSSAFGEMGSTEDLLMKDSTELVKMGSATVYILNTNKPAGSYKFVPAKSKEGRGNVIKIGNCDNRVIFVKIGVSEDKPVQSFSQIISFEEFAMCYKNAKWLRKSLSEVGFETAEALAAGLLPVEPYERCLGGSAVKAYKYSRKPGDTILLDDDMLKTEDSSDAQYMSVFGQLKDGVYEVKDYFLKTGGIAHIYYCTTPDSSSRKGLYKSYSKEGNLVAEGNYDNNKQNGAWKYNYDTTGNPVWYTCTYDGGMYNGMLRSYYLSGKVKREEQHKLFTDSVYYMDGKVKKAYANTKDSIVSGKCYDEDGKEIKFTRFETMPQPGFEINRFLGSRIRYPDYAREHNIEGRVIAKFAVDKEGNVGRVRILKRVHPSIDDEAHRVILQFPAWQPGTRDDEPVSVWYTLPIMFKLE